MTLRKSIAVYPEGHRNTSPDPLPIKHGFIRVFEIYLITNLLQYAFDKDKLIQIICAYGIEKVINEKQLKLDNEYVNKLVDSNYQTCDNSEVLY